MGRGRRKWERQWRMSIGEEQALESVMEAEGIVWGEEVEGRSRRGGRWGDMKRGRKLGGGGGRSREGVERGKWNSELLALQFSSPFPGTSSLCL